MAVGLGSFRGPASDSPWRGRRLDITDELIGRSENSLWMVRPHVYCRMPLAERRRRRDVSIDAALDDLVWHSHVGVFLVDDLDDIRLRIIPAGRSRTALGIVTGSLQVLRGFAVVGETRRMES